MTMKNYVLALFKCLHLFIHLMVTKLKEIICLITITQLVSGRVISWVLEHTIQQDFLQCYPHLPTQMLQSAYGDCALEMWQV